ncbi:MAG: ferritin-like domain-containing protein [Nitrososphaerales archaeon]
MTERSPEGSLEGRPSAIKVTTREDLIFILSEASTLEHMVMCEYLFAAFSLKRNGSEGLSSEQLEKVRKWEGVITNVAVQEMLHLALVNNMLVSVGAGPYFHHPNFPQPSKYFSPNIKLALMPFGEQALRHFLYLERPEGMSIDGVPGFEVLGDLNPPGLEDAIVPQAQYFSTVGYLYRGVERGIEDLVEKYGEEGVFLGAGRTQATEGNFGWPDLIAVTDLSSATRAIEEIVENGEGARGNWENAHFGMFLGVFKEFVEKRRSDPDFNPTRPVVAAYSRLPIGTENVPLISDTFTSRVADLFNATYGLAIQCLSRFYVHEGEQTVELQLLADTAVGLMADVIKPLGIALTTQPIGSRLPGLTAGPSFELQQKEYLLPHREQALMILQERLVELSKYSASLAGEARSPDLSRQFNGTRESLLELAKGFSS